MCTLPDIWSPLKYDGDAELGRNLIPYEFQWIEEIGSNMITEIEIYSGRNNISKIFG